ncbi:MAG: alanine racemase [Microbacterium sp.]
MDEGMQRIVEVVAEHSDEFDTPVVVVLGDRLRANIARMQAFADRHGVALRPHAKTHKSVDVARLQLYAGAQGLTVSTLGQAEVFANAGIDDIFLAYPLWVSATKAARIAALTERADLKLGVDSRAAIDAMAAHGLDALARLELVVEVDCGARRSGIEPAAAGELAAYARDRGLQVAGVYTYPGHGWAAGKAEGAGRDQAEALRIGAASLAQEGISARIVSAGSTPTARFSASDGVTEIRPGEYVFSSMDLYHHGTSSAEEIALFVATTVISDGHGPTQIVDSGTMTLGREIDAQGRYGWIAGSGTPLSRLNEYHGFLFVDDGARFPVGTVLPIVPNHACTVVQNAAQLFVLEPDGTSVRYPVSQFDPAR